MTNPLDSAFPGKQLKKPNEEMPVTSCDVPGLTKREFFAAMAMQSCIKYAPIVAPQIRFKDCAKLAIKHADALIAELNK